MHDEVICAVAGDPPPTMVESHVVVSAEQDPAIDVGSALISVPLVDVMGFTVRRGPVAASPPASAVPDR